MWGAWLSIRYSLCSQDSLCPFWALNSPPGSGPQDTDCSELSSQTNDNWSYRGWVETGRGLMPLCMARELKKIGQGHSFWIWHIFFKFRFLELTLSSFLSTTWNWFLPQKLLMAFLWNLSTSKICCHSIIVFAQWEELIPPNLLLSRFKRASSFGRPAVLGGARRLGPGERASGSPVQQKGMTRCWKAAPSLTCPVSKQVHSLMGFSISD